MKRLAKKATLLLCAVAMLFSALFVTVSASGICISVESVEIEVGSGTKTVDVPVVISGNTGVLGMILNVTYGEGIILTNITEGTALGTLTMTKPGDFSANPFKIGWDGEDENDTDNGTIVTLTFSVPVDEEKEFLVSITTKGMVNDELNKLNPTTVDGKITVCDKSSSDDTIIDSGTDANGITWTLYDTGVLCVSGSGAMEDYSLTSKIPWYSSRQAITEVVIGEGVTHIAEKAFYGCINMTKITVPNSVASVGTNAFRNCDEMTIYAEAGSFIQSYAEENEIPFVNTKIELKKDIIVDYAATSKKMYFDISVEDFSEDAMVYVALYDSNDKALDITSEPFVVGDITSLSLSKNATAAYAKIFVWSNTIKPLTNIGIVTEL